MADHVGVAEVAGWAAGLEEVHERIASRFSRIAAVPGLFEHSVIAGCAPRTPVPAARRSSGLRGKHRGPLGHLDSARPTGGRLVRQHRRLPESLAAEEISEFLADLMTFRDPRSCC